MHYEILPWTVVVHVCSSTQLTFPICIAKISLIVLKIKSLFLIEYAGEWWKSDVETVINQAMQTGLPPNLSDAHTINGRPGPVPNCSLSSGTSFLVNNCLVFHN